MASASSNDRPKATAVPYQGEPLPNVPEDLVVPNIVNLDFEERLWVLRVLGLAIARKLLTPVD